MREVPVLTTERLTLRGWEVHDVEPYARICADAETMRFIGDGHPMPREQAWNAVAALTGHWTLRGFGQWAVTDRETGVLLGRIGLHQPDDWPGIELGWLLGRSHWGKGLATEGATAARDWAFGELGLDELISLIQPGNGPSVGCAGKIGMRFREQVAVRGWVTDVYATCAPR
jgi:RimJ/RimL family protein N-acetyltransferase